MASVTMTVRINTDYNGSVEVDGRGVVGMHGNVNSANPGNYNLSKTINDEATYEANKSEVDEQCNKFEAMVKASANSENGEGSNIVYDSEGINEFSGDSKGD